MDTSKHVVTIPIEDYNKLIAAKELDGLVEIKPDHPFYKILKMAAEANYRQEHYKEFDGDIIKTLGTFYFKKA